MYIHHKPEFSYKTVKVFFLQLGMYVGILKDWK